MLAINVRKRKHSSYSKALVDIVKCRIKLGISSTRGRNMMNIHKELHSLKANMGFLNNPTKTGSLLLSDR
jgi:hypothetical protein